MTQIPTQPPSPESSAEEIAVEAAAFRRLVAHLQSRSDVQNIELMELAGFCRNCLSKWYREEAEARGQETSLEAARERIYGMPYEAWKAAHQRGPRIDSPRDES